MRAVRQQRLTHPESRPWPRILRSWYIETFGGYQFAPDRDELEAHGDAGGRVAVRSRAPRPSVPQPSVLRYVWTLFPKR